MAKVVNIDGTDQRPPKAETPPKAEAKAKPRAARAAAAAEEPAIKRRTPADKKLAAELASTYQGIGMAIIGVGTIRQDEGVMGSGAQVVNQAEHAAEAWLDLADQNPKVKAALKKFTEASAIGSLVAVHLSMAVPLLASRGVIPSPLAAAMSGATMNGATPDA